MEALLAFVATLVSLRLSADLARRYRVSRAPELLAWSAALGSFAVGSGALAWGAAADWSNPAFRVYYLFGGLLAAALLGAGSLLRIGVRRVGPVTLVYVGLAIGIAVAVPLTAPVTGSSIPEAQAHLELFPARVLAIVGNSVGTIAAVSVALLGLRRRPLGNSLILAGLVVGGARQRTRWARRGRVGAVLGGGRPPPLRRLRRPYSRIGASAGRSARARRRRSLSHTPADDTADEQTDSELGDQPRCAAVCEEGHARDNSQRPPTV